MLLKQTGTVDAKCTASCANNDTCLPFSATLIPSSPVAHAAWSDSSDAEQDAWIHSRNLVAEVEIVHTAQVRHSYQLWAPSIF